MALFQTEGWNLNAQVKKGGSSTKPKKNNKKEGKNGRIDKKKKEKRQKKEKKVAEVEKVEVVEEVKKVVETQEETQEETPKDVVEDTSVQEQEVVVPQRKLTPLQQKMMSKLTGSRFRWINEQLYTITSDAALQLVKDQPSLFDEYHEGFRSQVQSWPENPVDVFVKQIKERSKKIVNAPGGLPGLGKEKKIIIADMGCGEAQFSLDISKFLKEKRKGPKLNIEVHSFDLKKANNRITVADIRNVPLPDNSCTIVIFCLALMGTNFLDFIKEAYRILAPRGELWIAEIKSRFTDKDGKGEEFVNSLKLQGFFHKNTDSTNKMFTRFEFFKASQDIIDERKAKLERRQKFIEHETEKEELENKRKKIPEGKWLLKPCIYKRR